MRSSVRSRANMLSLLTILVCGVTGVLSVPLPAASMSTLPDYFVIESIPQLGSGPGHHNGAASPETEAKLRREEEVQARLRDIKKHVLYMLNLPCVPRGPPDSASFNIDPEHIQILHHLMQNQTDTDSEDLLKRAQSFYPTCDLPEEASFLFRQHRDSMNIFFNLSSFFLPQPENVTIDMAELRLYRVPSTKGRRRRRPSGFNFGRLFNELESESVRVSVYATSASLPGTDRLVDSFLAPRYSSDAVTMNVSSAVWSTDDLNLLLRVTVEDVFGGSLPADTFFVQMDCRVVNESPLPRPLVHYFSQHNIQVEPRNLYPVLDLSTAEATDFVPSAGFVPSIEPCPEPASLTQSQPPPDFRAARGDFSDSFRTPSRRPRRRHHRRPHNRRHSGRRGQRYRGQH